MKDRLTSPGHAARVVGKRVVAFARSRSRLEWLFALSAFTFGMVAFVIFMCLLVMPVYLLAGQGITVPDFRGKSWTEAHDLARRSQVFIERNGWEYNDTVPKSHIAFQQPVAGALVKPGRRVFVVISRGPESVVVPDVLGKSRRDAELTILEAGLTVGEERLRTSRQFASGVVMRQYPKAGMQVQAGTGVSLHIAR